MPTKRLLDHWADQVHAIVEGVGELSASADKQGEATPIAYRLNDALTALERAYCLLACVD